MIFTRQSFIGNFLAATSILALLLWPAVVGALPGPTSQQFITPYPAIASAVVNTDATASQPIAFGAVALGNGALSLQVQTDTLDVPMDAYLAILAPRLALGILLLVNADGGLQPFTGTLVPWKTSITTLNESLFGSIPLMALPADDYSVYLLLVRAGAGNPLGGNFYLWASTLPLGTASGTEGVNNLTLFTNPTDSSLLSFFTDTGEQLALLGVKDDDGTTKFITQLDLVDEVGDRFAVELDAYGLLSRVSDKEGNFISFDFTRDRDSGIKWSLSGDFISYPVNAVWVEVGTSGEGVVFSSSIVPNAPISVNLDDDLPQLQAWEPDGNLFIEVFQCGEPATPSSVAVMLGRPGMGFTNRYPAFSMSAPGKYVASIPQHDDTTRDVVAACESVESALSKMCAANGPAVAATLNPGAQTALCIQLAATVEAANPFPGDSVAVFPLCLAAFKAADVACKTLGLSTDPTPDSTSVLKVICGKTETALRTVDSTLGVDSFVLQAMADFRGGTPAIGVPGSYLAASDKVTVSDHGPYPTLTINHDEGCEGPSLEGMQFPAYFKGTGSFHEYYSNPNYGVIECSTGSAVYAARAGGIGVWYGRVKVFAVDFPTHGTAAGELECRTQQYSFTVANGGYTDNGTFHEDSSSETFSVTTDISFNKDRLWGSSSSAESLPVMGGEQLTRRQWEFDLQPTTEEKYNALIGQ